MIKHFSVLLIALSLLPFALCQAQTSEELEKQRQQLKKEIEQTERLLNNNKEERKANLEQWKRINNMVNLQDRVIDNINKDLNLLNKNIYSIQRDIFKYDKLLDTLKDEYARSMVYAYKNRSNYDFLNFIFSASSFNDAIKRIAYMKSYRSYREMQGENILRTQELRKQRINDLSGIKQKKNVTLQVQSKEMQTLESQKKEKDRILAQLKKQGKELNRQIAAKQKQMKKVNNAIAAAILRAQNEAKKAALAAEKKRREAEILANPASGPKNVAAPTKAEKSESVLLNSGNLALNASFEKNRGSLPWPVDRGLVLMHYGSNKLPSGSTIVVNSITISSDIGSPVKTVFDGIISAVTNVEDIQVVVIQHGRYFSTYSNLSGVSVQKGQQVRTGQVIGKVAPNFDGNGEMDFYLMNEKNNYDPESWLRRR